MIILGGRNSNATAKIPLELLDMDTNVWSQNIGPSKFRDCSWNYEALLYSFGGFDLKNLSTPTCNLVCADLKNILEIKKENTFEESKITPKLKIEINHSIEYATTDKRQVKELDFAKLNEETKKIGPKSALLIPISSPQKISSIVSKVIGKLLKPKDWIIKPITISEKFAFSRDIVIDLAKQCLSIVMSQTIVLEVKSPVKVFGDIHGQYIDLMRFFDLWRSPTDINNGGDIDSYDYLFLGDYVDRGLRSLETICLLMALKIKFPSQIHLLRGNHEDIAINSMFGFAEECADRLNEDIEDPNSAFKIINAFFDCLPLAAVIDKSALCIHGGIGSSLHSVEDIKKLHRPIQIVHEVLSIEHQILIDILWSDPTESDDELGIQANLTRDPHNTGYIVKFGPDRVEQFLKSNKLQMIFRGHECVMDGIERFAKGQLMTIFSATDYCGQHKNAGAMLVIQKDLKIVPRLIYPSEDSSKNWYEEKPGSPERPHTPPIWVTSHHSFS
jgi:diadenosine tetraphosphatase ApaH/serine/threonine PP2A family protein phosphatase